MSYSCVPAFPIRPIDSGVGGVLHPLPVALGEMRKLCEVEQSCVGADFESICETRRIPIPGSGSTNPHPPSSGALGMPSSTGGIEERVPIAYSQRLTYPLWELLSPSVVIRRRPKRVQGLRIT